MDKVRIGARNTRAACLCILETWLDESVFDSEVHIDSYCIQRRDINRQGGGVCIYVKRDMAFNSLDDLDHNDLKGDLAGTAVTKV